jgi:hypothetical protein
VTVNPTAIEQKVVDKTGYFIRGEEKFLHIGDGKFIYNYASDAEMKLFSYICALLEPRPAVNSAGTNYRPDGLSAPKVCFSCHKESTNMFVCSNCGTHL